MLADPVLAPSPAAPLAVPPAASGLSAADWAAQGRDRLAAGDPQAARLALRCAIAAGCTDGVTLLNLALAEHSCGEPRAARRRMRDVARAMPVWEEPVLRLAESLRARRPRLAERLYAQVLDIAPGRREALIASGVLHLRRGDAATAQLLLLRACGVAPEAMEAWDALGLALLAGNNPAMALTAFNQAARLAPTNPEITLHAVKAAMAAGQAEAELARLQARIAAAPSDPVPLIAAAALHEHLGQPDQAIDLLEAAEVLAPAALPAAMLGTLLAGANRVAEAAAALGRAHARDPGNTRIANDYAAVLMRQYRHATAHALLADLVARHGPSETVLSNLTTATVNLGQQDQAVRHARAALALAPRSPLAHRTLCNTLPYHPDTTGAALLAALRTCSAQLARPAPAMPFLGSKEAERLLRIGLLSGGLRTHPVGWLTVAGFEALDPARHALIALAQTTGTDALARRFQAIAREWHDTGRMDDAALAEKSRALGLDLVIDLGGYGDTGRMAACARRLAPVQVKWVGMQNHSSGLAEMDWMITDRWETPADLAHLYSERLLVMPDGYVCYSPPAYAPDVSPLPAARHAGVTFGCFNNLAKVTPRVIETWSEILRALPTARLILKTHQFADAETGARIHAAFAAHGVAADRVLLRGSSRHRDFLAEYNEVDIVLDPFPYCGGLTTCEALWMGVPTLTLPGEIFAARHSLSHLSNAGLADWAAPDRAAYVAMAVARAGDIPALAALRAGLRARVAASPLCDGARFGRHLGQALRHAWRAWCDPRLTDAQSRLVMLDGPVGVSQWPQTP